MQKLSINLHTFYFIGNFVFYFAGETIILHGYEIVPLYDTPHLFKCLRNNLLTKLLEIEVGSKERKYVSWDVVEAAYEKDKIRGPDRHLKKITSVHVSPDNFQKMRVKYAVQVFSKTLATEIESLAKGNFTNFFVYLRGLDVCISV